MFRVNGGRLAVGIGAIALFCAWSAFVWTLGLEYYRHGDGDQQTGHQHTGKPDTDLHDLCFGRAPVAMISCIEEYIKTNQDSEYSARDLRAQEGMATWAFWMLWVSGFGVLVTGIGVGYVALTLAATQRTLDVAVDANKIAIESRRAWLSISFKINWVDIGERTITMNGFFVIENIGSEYAENIFIEREALVFTGALEDRLSVFWAKHRQKMSGTPCGTGASLLPQETMRQNIHLSAGMSKNWRNSCYRITPVASVRYTSPNGEQWLVTERSFEIWLRAPGMRTQEGEFFHGTRRDIDLGTYRGDDVRVTALEAGETR